MCLMQSMFYPPCTCVSTRYLRELVSRTTFQATNRAGQLRCECLGLEPCHSQTGPQRMHWASGTGQEAHGFLICCWHTATKNGSQVHCT